MFSWFYFALLSNSLSLYSEIVVITQTKKQNNKTKTTQSYHNTIKSVRTVTNTDEAPAG